MNKQDFSYQVIVVGGGHAGMEAAYIAAKMGVKTALITLDVKKIALMPCNPSIGGLGKGHIVYEVSALGGLMPQLCSKTYLQARMLNTSKGPAVQGLRLQIDKYAYTKAAQVALKNTDNLDIIEGMVQEIVIESEDGNKKVTGVQLASGELYTAPNIIITTGTFLNGRVHIGSQAHDAGRMGEDAAKGLSGNLAQILGLELGRLKTGTPPRLLRSSLNLDLMETQPSHELDFLFEWEPVHAAEKMPCYITYTNESTHQVIHDNLEKSAMYSGRMCQLGPRYCPSIEDKIGRFPDRASHHVFVEPEGVNNDEVYPAGLSTSLPLDVQKDYIQTIKGFENAIISQAGYSVEYDFVQPTHLGHTLESKSISGLFFAGQINGTTGYEEAAGQGIIAGINAACNVQGKERFVLTRQESYIGVMIDDLVTLGADEPYRMFTSRAERRLILRQDNVFRRLMPKAYELGLVSEQRYNACMQEKAVIELCVYHLSRYRQDNPTYTLFAGIDFDNDTMAQAKEGLIAQIVAKQEKYERMFDGQLSAEFLAQVLNARVMLGIHAEIKYAGYLDRELKEVEKAQKFAEVGIPASFDYSAIDGLSIELRQKLAKHRPDTIAQAQLVPGMTPAAISVLIFQVTMLQRKMSK